MLGEKGKKMTYLMASDICPHEVGNTFLKRCMGSVDDLLSEPLCHFLCSLLIFCGEEKKPPLGFNQRSGAE